MYLFIQKPLDEGISDVIAIRAKNKEEAVRKFLGDEIDLKDDNFVMERFHFINDLANNMSDVLHWPGVWPAADKIIQLISESDFDNVEHDQESAIARELLSDPEFRQAATQLLSEPGETTDDVFSGFYFPTETKGRTYIFVQIVPGDGSRPWSLEDINLIPIVAGNLNDAIDRFLSPNLDDESIEKHVEFISNLAADVRYDLSIINLGDDDSEDEFDYENPQHYVLELTQIMDKRFHRLDGAKYLMNYPLFRDLSKELLMDHDSVSSFFHLGYSDDWDLIKHLQRITKELVKKNNLHKLLGMYDVYCSSNDYENELYGMAKGLDISLLEKSLGKTRPNHEWLCKTIGALLIIAKKTGMALNNLLPALRY